MNRRRFHRFVAAGAAGLALPASVRAQEVWPSRPISMVIPFPPGGNTDFMARITAEWLSRTLGTSVVPENRAGAGGTIAAEFAARAKPDGYTLFFASVTQLSLARFLYKLRYDPINDFVPVSNVGGNPLVLTVASSSKLQTLDDLIRYGRQNPGKLTVGHAGEGSLSHMSAAMFLHRAKIEATMVPYKGGAPALADMIGGQTELYSANISEIMPHVGSGRVRFLGVSSLAPIPQLPGVPTIAATFPGHQIETWNGLVAPAGVPAPIVDRLAADVAAMLADPGVRKRFNDAGVIPQEGQTKQAFAARIARDIELWAPMVQAAGIKPQ